MYYLSTNKYYEKKSRRARGQRVIEKGWPWMARMRGWYLGRDRMKQEVSNKEDMKWGLGEFKKEEGVL